MQHDIELGLELIQRDHKLIEIRAKTPYEGWVSGLYDDRSKLIQAVIAMNEIGADVYWTHNRLRHLPATNQLVRGGGVRNRDVARISNVFFDIDPLIPGGANQLADDLADYLNWPEPIVLSSGRGRYLFYPTDLEPHSVSTIRNAMKNLKRKFDSDKGAIDAVCVNVGRVSRVPGSKNHKLERPADCRILNHATETSTN